MISDFHNDLLTEDQNFCSERRSKEVCCAVCALFRGEKDYGAVRAIAQAFVQRQKPNLALGLEDISYWKEENADEIAFWNPIYASLTWNGRNALAGGCMDGGGLTERGKRVLRFLKEQNICLDCAHLNQESFREVLKTDLSIIDSHTCFAKIWEHPRNLEDWQIAEIVRRGGLIGITFVGRFLCRGPATAQDVFRHIDYGVQKYGCDYFCLGTDFGGTSDLPSDLQNYEQADSLREQFWKAGYPPQSIEKILVENLQGYLAKKDRKRRQSR